MTNKVLAIDASASALREHKIELNKIDLLLVRVGAMRDAIMRLRTGEEYRFVIINEDTVPDLMLYLSELCNAARTHVFITTRSYDKSKHTEAMRLGADAYVAFGDTAKIDVECTIEQLDLTPKWIRREIKWKSLLAAGDILLSPIQRKVYMREKPVDLSKIDFDILQYFIRNTGHVLSHGQIFHKIWGRELDEKDHKRLWNHVYTLRRVIETSTGSNEYIRTEKDYGYRFLPPCNALNYAVDKLA